MVGMYLRAARVSRRVNEAVKIGVFVNCPEFRK
jgi:hypothetical protein